MEGHMSATLSSGMCLHLGGHRCSISRWVGHHYYQPIWSLFETDEGRVELELPGLSVSEAAPLGSGGKRAVTVAGVVQDEELSALQVQIDGIETPSLSVSIGR